MSLAETLSFLFQLNFLTFGSVSFLFKLKFDIVSCPVSQCTLTSIQDYSTEGMSENQLLFLQHLRELGLVFQRKVKFFQSWKDNAIFFN